MAQEKTDAAVIENTPKPNLIFVGHKINRVPVESFTDGNERITLPKTNEQMMASPNKGEEGKMVSVPFYHKQPSRVVQVLGSRLYKFYEGDGAKDGGTKSE